MNGWHWFVGVFIVLCSGTVVFAQEADPSGNHSGSSTVSIQNEYVLVQAHLKKNTFRVESKQTDQPVVRHARLFEKMSSADVRPVAQSYAGRGTELQLTLKDGSTVDLRLFNGHPFLHVHASVHNPGNEPLVMEKLELMNLKVDIDGDPIMSYGTGGLRGPSEKKRTV